MSSKSETKEEKIFNGGSLVEWSIARETIELEADRLNCKYQLFYQESDIVDGAVLEAVFSGQRICVKGEEEEFVSRSIDQQIEAVGVSADAKRQRIEALNYGVGAVNQLQKSKDLNAVADKQSDDVTKLQQSKFKLVLDAQAAGARYDSEVRQFDADRAKAIGLLRKYLGSNPKNNIAKELSDLRPRAAWKKLTDIYAGDAATASHLNNTTNLMSGLKFEKSYGTVAQHMGVLDKLNETLVAAGRGKSDAELLNYLISAMERSKDGAMYKTTLDVISVFNRGRQEVLDALRGVEQKAMNAAVLRGSQTIAGARFGEAEVVIAATADAETTGKRKRNWARRTKPDDSESFCFKCSQRGHRARDCPEDVICNFCKKTNHCEAHCWVKYPDKKPAHMRANAANVESDTEKRDITKVRGQIDGFPTDSKGSSLELHSRAMSMVDLLLMDIDTHDRADCDSPALDVTAALGTSHAEKRPVCDSGQESEDSALASIDEGLLRDINIVRCRRCRKGFSCSPSSDSQEVNEVAASAVVPIQSRCVVIIDSGATRHMLPERSGFTDLNNSVNGVVVLGKKSYKIDIEGEGHTRLGCLNRVLLVPALSMGLLSMGQLDRDGYCSTVCDGVCTVTDKQSQEVVLVCHRKQNNLYYLDTRFAKLLSDVVNEDEDPNADEEQGDFAQVAAASDEGWQHLHRTLGHLSHSKMLKGLKNNNWLGIPISYDEGKMLKLPFCAECYEGKMKAFPRGDRSERDVAVGEKFGIDYKGKFMVKSLDGYNGFYLVGDYASDFLAVFMVRSKAERVTLKILDEYVAMMRRAKQKTPSVMQCDYDTVLRSKLIADWLRAKDLKLQMSAPYTHWQNGFIEANMGKIMDNARTLMADGRVPARFWSYAVRCAVYLSNRVPITKSDLTPYELVYNEKVDTSFWVPFWSNGVCHVTDAEREGQFARKARRVRMVGYDEAVKNGYLVYDVVSKTVTSRHDCIWDKDQVREEFGVGTNELRDDDDLDSFEEDIRDSAKEVVGNDGGRISAGDIDAAYDRYALPDGDDPYNFALLTETELVDWIEENCEVVFSAEAEDDVDQPKTLEEAFAGPDADHWKDALKTEVSNFEVREVFGDAPQFGQAMKTKIILKKIRKPDGSFKYKVRLVAKGFTQIKGVNYNETYAPTISTVVVLMSLHLCASNGFYLASFDVTAAFLEGKNDYPNFAWLPKEFGGKRVQVIGNFYGEKQAPKIWNDQLNEILIKGGLERCPAHPCLYRYWTPEGDVIFLCVHVDDGLVVSNNRAVIDWLEAYLKGCLTAVTFERTVKKYIGFDVDYRQEEHKVILTHESYITDKWKDFTDTVLIPMSPSHNLRTAERVERELTMLHDTGEFRYICDRARPDILVATGEIATGGDKNPSLLHEKVSLRVKNYLTETKSLGLVLGGVDREIEIFGYSDAAYITQGNCKSRLGGCIFLNRHSGAIRSFSKTDSQVSDPISHSSTEAEIKAMDEWVLEAMHVVDLLSFLVGKRYDKPVKLFVDNQSAIILCTTLKQRHKVQQINLRIHFIREMILKGFLTVHFVPTEENVADALTKALGQLVFGGHRKILLTGHDGKLPRHKAGPTILQEDALPCIIDAEWLLANCDED